MTKNKSLRLVARWIVSASRALPSSATKRRACDEVATFYQADGRALTRYLTAIYGDREDAAEVVQETYFRMCDLLYRGHTIDEPKVWAYRVARNLMLDRLTARKHDTAKVGRLWLDSPRVDDETPEKTLLAKEMSQERRVLVNAAFAKLTEIERQCVLGRGHGLSLREMAAIVGLTTKRVSQVTCRGIEKMRSELGD